ncbi:gem-associated protein 5-like isoform X2 [Maniola jurtina]|uniref:gem-associated protein 5-like isoform X2 n=1 Tax=Maniola jurtina TaxID=191418 RepID=UPI001E68CF97|nr:gem-associated protein 5-like isoform X2 [Maniola jurtina]
MKNGTVIFPSPNWFQVSGLAVSNDGWLVYGGPSKSLCVLEPLNPNNQGSGNENCYQAHVVNRAHLEKIVSVDISREWPEKKLFLTGSADGSVKQWSLEYVQNTARIKSTHCLDIYQNEKEEVAGVGYSSESFAITVGNFGNIIKWDLKSNVAKTYSKFLKKFKPTCIACSHHVPLNVAVGTKQGVVFVLDLNGQGKIVYKVRGQDDEVVNVSWCPQYEVLLRKSFNESIRKSSAMKRLEKIRSEVEEEENLDDSGVAKNLPDDSFDESIVQEDDTFDIYKDHEADEFGHKKFEPKDIMVRVKEEKEQGDFLTECLKLKEDILKIKNESEESVDNLVEALDNTHVDSEAETSDVTSTNKEEAIPDAITESSAHIQKHLLATIGKCGGVRLWSKSGKLVGSCAVPTGVNKKSSGPLCTTILWYKPDVLLIADGKSQLLECNPLTIDCKKKLQWKVVHSLHKRGLYCIASNAPRVQSADKSSDPSSVKSSNCLPDQWYIWTVAQDRNVICYSMKDHEKVAIYNTCGSSIYTIQSCPYDAKSVVLSVGDGAVRVWGTDTLEEDDTKLSLGQVTTYWQKVQGKVLVATWHPTRDNLLAFATAESRVGLIDASGKMERPARTLVPALRGAIYSLCWGDGYDLYASGGGRLVRYCTNKSNKDPEAITVEFEGQKWEVCCVNWQARGLLCGSLGGAVAVLDPSTRDLLTVAFVFNKMIHSMEWHPQQTSSSSEESPYKDLIAISSLDKSFEIAIFQYADKGDGLKLHKWKSLSGHKNAVLQLAWNPHREARLLSSSHDSTVRVWDVVEGVCVAIFGRHVQSSLGVAWSAFPQLSSTVLSSGMDCCLRVWRVEDYPPAAYTEIKHEVAPKKKKEEKKSKAKTCENKEVEPESAETSTGAGQVATTVLNKLKPPRRFLLPWLRKQMSRCNAHSLRQMAEKILKTEEISKNNQEIDPKVVKSEEIETNGDLKNEIKTNGDHKNDEIETNSDHENDESSEEEPETNEVKENEKVCVEFWKIFGNTNDLNEVLDIEMHRHLKFDRFEAWCMVSLFRGHVDATLQAASRRDALCPFLLSIAPSVSFKYWKDVTQLYLAQIERLVAKGADDKHIEAKRYGGSVYQRVALLLSVHELKSAVTALVDARLYPEAYVLARARHVDSLAADVLHVWRRQCNLLGRPELVAMCYLALGDVYKAAVSLANSNNQDLLSLAADLAKAAGQPTFATHIEDKKSLILSETPDVDAAEDLKELPSKIDVLKGSIKIADEDETIISENED